MERSQGGQSAAEELDELQEQLTSARRARLHLETELGGRATVETAIGHAERDRDAVSTPELESLRQRGDELADRLVTAWYGADALRALRAMVRAAGVDTGEGVSDRAFDTADADERTHRREIAEALDSGGVRGIPVPEPFTTQLDRHPRQDVIDRWLGRS